MREGDPILSPPEVLGPAQVQGHFAPSAQGMNIAFRQSQFPTAQEAEVYERLHPGAFGRVLTMAEVGQQAQIEATKRSQDYAFSDTRRGHWLGWSAIVIAVVLATIEGDRGHTAVAIALLGLPVFAAILRLITGARAKRDEA